MTSFYSLYYAAAVEAAIYADLWIRVQNGISDDNAPRPNLREILHPPRFEQNTPPPTYDHNSPASDDIVLPFAEQEPATPPQERSRYPQGHPGQDWYFNHPRMKRAYPFTVSVDGVLTRMRYIRYLQTNRYVYDTILHTPELQNRRTQLTPPQVRIFDSDTIGRTEVNRALNTLDDWPITAEVAFYRTTVAKLEEQHDQVAQLRQQMANTMTEIKTSVKRLSQHDVYRRIQQIIQREDDHTLWASNADLRAEMQLALEHPDSALHRVNMCLGIKNRIVSAHISYAGTTATYPKDTTDTLNLAGLAQYHQRLIATKNLEEHVDATNVYNNALSDTPDPKEGVMLRYMHLPRFLPRYSLTFRHIPQDNYSIVLDVSDDVVQPVASRSV
ncbi:hypothetical protein EDB87DRAFT_1722967 [Lactarius vividus]|nr:hypothetical protein EDB87DRAFT_1722967 [Lactarius vividus]